MAEILLRDLEPGAIYGVQVRTQNEQGFSEWSPIFTFMTLADTIPPSVPGSLSWTSSGTSFVATYTRPPEPDFKDYEITIKTGAFVNKYYTTSERWDFTLEMNKAAHLGVPKPNLNIEVRARDMSGNLSAPATASASNPPPAAPTGVTAVGRVEAIIVSWNANTEDDFDRYEVYMSTTSSFVPAAGNKVWSGKATSVTLPAPNLLANYIVVRAVDVMEAYADASQVTATATSGTEVDTTAPGVPATFTGTTVLGSDGYSAVDLTWSAVADADLAGYRIRWSGSSTGDWSYITTDAAATATRIRTLLPSTNYYIQIQAFDQSFNSSAWKNLSTYPITTAADTAAPPTPATPTASGSTLRIMVTQSPTDNTGAVMPADLDHWDVYVDTTSGFTPTSGNRIGRLFATLPSLGVSAIDVFSYPVTDTSTTRYVKTVAVDRVGNRSAASAAATVVVNLIDNANIADATIGDAKIGSVSATKLVAGTAFTNNLFVESTFTIRSTGFIQSNNYDGTAKTGFRLSPSGLDLWQGQVSAAALLIQQSTQNLMHPAYADFEFNNSFYSFPVVAGLTVAIGTSGVKFGTYGATAANTSGSTQYVHFGSSLTDYNVDVETGVRYIFSVYATATTATTLNMRVKQSDGSYVGTNVDTSLTAGTSKRIYGTFDPTQPKVMAAIQVPTGVTVHFDGLQIERKIGALETPSQWTTPGVTQINGYQIRTGEIRSTSLNAQNQPLWSVNLAGNMQVNDALVRGAITVGESGNAQNANFALKSWNYSAGTAGWAIKGDGSVEFVNGNFRGDITGATGAFRGTLQVGWNGSYYNANIDSSGNLWLGNSTFVNAQTAGFAVSSAGALYASSATVSGTINATGGSLHINNKFHVDSSGNMWFGSSSTYDANAVFRVDNTGAFRATSGSISGALVSGALLGNEIRSVATPSTASTFSISPTYPLRVWNSAATETIRLDSNGDGWFYGNLTMTNATMTGSVALIGSGTFSANMGSGKQLWIRQVGFNGNPAVEFQVSTTKHGYVWGDGTRMVMESPGTSTDPATRGSTYSALFLTSVSGSGGPRIDMFADNGAFINGARIGTYPLAFHISGTLTNGSKMPRHVIAYNSYAANIYALTGSGTCTVILQKNGVNWGNPINVTTSASTIVVNGSINQGDTLGVNVSNAAGTDLSVTVGLYYI